VLLICPDILPLPGLPTTGAGLRTWGIGQGLEAHGHEVIYSLPVPCLSRGYEIPRSFTDYAWDFTGVEKVVRRTNPDVVVFSHWPSVQLERKLDLPTVLDFHGPHMLEREMQGYGDRSSNAWHKVQALRKADFFTCAGDKQRAYFLGWLTAAGIPLAANIIATIPVALSPAMPEHRWTDGEPVFVYGGVFLPWQDPTAGLRALVRAMESRGLGRLQFYGGSHPVYEIKRSEQFQEMTDELGRCARVAHMGYVSHDRLIEDYCQAHVALDVMARNPERELAFTTRTVEYMWCGLPVIYQDFSELSNLIREYEAGWVVDPSDTVQVESAVVEALTEPAEVRRRGQNAQQLVRERLVWDRAIEPLDAFCRDPWQIDPLTMPVWSRNPKGLKTLLREVGGNLRDGGVRAVVFYGARYLRNQLRFLRE
jgi:glycosyltransferase involved in cell wall biosynthesis